MDPFGVCKETPSGGKIFKILKRPISVPDFESEKTVSGTH